MPHDTPLISTIVGGLVLAFIFGAIANRFRMPPLVGYLIAGVVVGPYTPGFVADGELALELAEIGVILLMFGVGLHFSLKDLVSVRGITIPGAIAQIGGATLLGLGLALLMGWTIGAGLIFGLALSVASTVVLLKALQDRRLIDSERGKIAVGWLIVEDLAMVLALVLIPAIAAVSGVSAAAEVHDPFVSFVERSFNTELGIVGILVVTVVKLAAFVGCMLVIGRRVIPFVLHATAHTGSRELFRLAVLAIALGVAAGASYLFGVSLALGAFFAGMILSESELSHRAAQESLPLRDAFAVLFFVSVGMLFDPWIIIEDPLPVLATVFIIVFGKSIFAFLIVIAFGRPVGTALTISASLAQIGEFSFILAALGVGLGILPVEGRDLILAGAIISIILNPLAFYAIELIKPHLEQRLKQRPGEIEPSFADASLSGVDVTPDGPVTEPIPETAARTREDVEPSSEPTRLSGHTILVGYGRVGSVVAEGLAKAGAPFLVIEDAEGRTNAARAAGIEVIVGNAAASSVLALANVEAARTAIVAIPNAFEAGQTVEQCRKLNRDIHIIARAHSDEEVVHLTHLGADTVIMGEREIGLGMLGWLGGSHEDLRSEQQADADAAVIATALATGHDAAPLVPEAPIAAPAPQPVEPAMPVVSSPSTVLVHEPAEPAEQSYRIEPTLGSPPGEPAPDVDDAVTPPPPVLTTQTPSAGGEIVTDTIEAEPEMAPSGEAPLRGDIVPALPDDTPPAPDLAAPVPPPHEPVAPEDEPAAEAEEIEAGRPSGIPEVKSEPREP
jgi:CPA2 family monovalent cation:H+ antiporter-2